jgi:ornithine--oxo-acid transaminase
MNVVITNEEQRDSQSSLAWRGQHLQGCGNGHAAPCAGFGRCGDWLAYQSIGMQSAPHMVILSKGMTGGIVSLSAILMCDPEFSATFGRPGKAKIHGSTYSGNRLAVFCCLKTLEMMESMKIPREAHRMGKAVVAAIERDFGGVLTTHGCGLALTIELSDPQRGLADLYDLWKRLMHAGVLTIIAAHKPTAIRFSPALTFADEDLDFFLAGLKAAVSYE